MSRFGLESLLELPRIKFAPTLLLLSLLCLSFCLISERLGPGYQLLHLLELVLAAIIFSLDVPVSPLLDILLLLFFR